MTIAWSARSNNDRAGIALDLARSNAPIDLALAGFWLRCLGRDAEARIVLTQAGPAAAEVDAAFIP